MSSTLQRLAIISFLTVELLVFMGAIVRATGSGLGCPDWPFCYGQMIPPTKAEDIDFEHLNLEKFRRKAAQYGRDPSSITPESIRAEFNAKHTWIEYINRLSSMPVGFATLALLVVSFRQRRRYPRVYLAAVVSFTLVLVNAWLGAKVVLSGLKPGIITLHMALAILLLCVLVYAAWKASDAPWQRHASPRLWNIALILFILVVIEGVLGSQVREMTDHLAKTHAGEPRSDWVDELEHSWMYLVHRSGSWLLLALALWFGNLARKTKNGLGWLEKSIVGLVISQMVLGILLANVGILPTAQVLHIGLSSLLVSGLFLWLLAAKTQPSPSITA
jgi:heme a synthase